jgi:UDP-2,4-diacetamido-2,4,6-trideoxy-beta-L-altropyranose hydrolase
MKIIFITDGGLELGMGHVVQSISLAKFFINKAEITFFTKSSEIIIKRINDAGFNVVHFDNDSDMMLYFRKDEPDIIIFDKLDVDENFAKSIRNELSAKLVIFTNITSANKYAHLAVTADIGSEFKNISFIDNYTNTLYYFGPKYWILRDEFYQMTKKDNYSLDAMKRILLIFGGSDPSNLTTYVLKLFLENNSEYTIDVILGASFGFIDDINNLINKYKERAANITIYQNVNNVAQLMYQSDLVIASPGLSCFESLRIGTPVIVIPQNDLQKETYDGFFSILGTNEIDQLLTLIKNRKFTYPDSEFVKSLEIGNGIQEIIDEILK